VIRRHHKPKIYSASAWGIGHLTSLNILIAAVSSRVAYCCHAGIPVWRTKMAEMTCAACDYKLDTNSIKVRIGGKIVEVCCDECAQKLREAHASATAARKS
jgi:hypothetical protein